MITAEATTIPVTTAVRESTGANSLTVMECQPEDWDTIGIQILKIHKQAFNQGKKILPDEYLERFFKSPNYIKMILKNDDEIIGFILTNFSSDNHTAHVTLTALAKSYQGKGLVWQLQTKHDRKLLQKGCWFLRQETSNEGYVKKLKRFYGNKIIEEKMEEGNNGQETQFLIDLRK